jgi:hypothetical protein
MTPFEKIKLEHLYLESFKVFLMFASKVVTSEWSPVWLSALLQKLRLTRKKLNEGKCPSLFWSDSLMFLGKA